MIDTRWTDCLCVRHHSGRDKGEEFPENGWINLGQPFYPSIVRGWDHDRWSVKKS